MSFSLSQFLGQANTVTEHDFLENTDTSNWNDREQEIVAVLTEALQDLGQKLDGHIAVSAYGHVNPIPAPGDNIVININAVPDPGAPTQPVVTGTEQPPVDPAPPVTPGSTPLEAAQPGGSPAPPAGATPADSPGLSQPPAEPPPAEPAPEAAPPAAAPAPEAAPASEPPAAPPAPDPAAAPPPAPEAPAPGTPPAEPPAAPPEAADAPAEPAAAPQRTLYTTTEDPSAVDLAAWPLAPFTTDTGQPLYYYSGDIEAGQQNGSVVPGWTIYTAPPVPVAPAA